MLKNIFVVFEEMEAVYFLCASCKEFVKTKLHHK